MWQLCSYNILLVVLIYLLIVSAHICYCILLTTLAWAILEIIFISKDQHTKPLKTDNLLSKVIQHLIIAVYFLRKNLLHVSSVALFQTHELIAMPAPKYAKMWISVATRFGRLAILHVVVRFVNDLATVTLASHLIDKKETTTVTDWLNFIYKLPVKHYFHFNLI